MKVYIAGPMRGYPFYNFPSFDCAKVLLRDMGHEPVSPADLDRAYGFDPNGPDYSDANNCSSFPEGAGSAREVIKRDILAVLTCDAVAVLPGWAQSEGAKLEVALMKFIGGDVIDALTGEELTNQTTNMEL